jgi:glycosyltransferase involved in cell wall biosynthesis
VIARSPIEAATLAQRGVPTDRIWTVRDALPAHEAPPTVAPELPQLVFVGDLAPWSGWELLLEALARIKLPWRLTVVLPAEPSGAPVVARARAARLEARVHVVTSEAEVAWRVAGAQVVVCPILPARSVTAGGVVPEAALWALSCGRPLVAADLPVVRAYAGAAARYFEPGNPGALATALRAVLGDGDLRAELVERGREMRATLGGDESDRAVADLWALLAADDAQDV